MLLHAVHEAIVGVDALVIALQALPALVAGDAQRDAVLGAEFLELGHDARGDDGHALGVQAVHHRGLQLQLVLHRVREEVGVHEHRVRRHERRVVLEEERGADLRDLAHHRLSSFGGFPLASVFVAFFLVFLEAGVALADDTLDGGELAGFFDAAHGW